jgi:ion channel-forming bestrophin family protein
MHTGTSYKLSEFLIWTRRNIYALLVVGILPVVAFQVLGWRWLAIPWTVVALLGTATAFIVGFKNTQTYNRTWEARQIWGSILNSSRAWGAQCRDFVENNPAAVKTLIYRHFAWLTALRYQMRDPRAWESSSKPHNEEYSRYYTIPEKETLLDAELAKYLAPEELQYVLSTKNRAAQIMSLQSKTLRELTDTGHLDNFRFLELQKIVRDFYDQQGRSERIKNFPYPRQFATINNFFVRLFCLMLPFGMLKEFDRLNENVPGVMQGHMVWLVIPFSVLISWVYTSLEQVGESTENPFEGGANDVPISQMSRTIEIDLREMLGETDLPPAVQAVNNIVM